MHTGLWKKPLGKGTFVRSRRKEDNTEVNGRKIVGEDLKLMELVQDRIQ
jgi:hypothetical protein